MSGSLAGGGARAVCDWTYERFARVDGTRDFTPKEVAVDKFIHRENLALFKKRLA